MMYGYGGGTGFGEEIEHLSQELGTPSRTRPAHCHECEKRGRELLRTKRDRLNAELKELSDEAGGESGGDRLRFHVASRPVRVQLEAVSDAFEVVEHGHGSFLREELIHVEFIGWRTTRSVTTLEPKETALDEPSPEAAQ